LFKRCDRYIFFSITKQKTGDSYYLWPISAC